MSTKDPHPHTDRTDLRTLSNHGSWHGVFHALEVLPGAHIIDECETGDCTREDELQFVVSLEGDACVYCPTHRDRDWGVKI